jgi:hypothetical protein
VLFLLPFLQCLAAFSSQVKSFFFNEAHICKPSVIGMGHESCKICLFSCIWKVVESRFCLVPGDEEDGYSNFNHYL